MRKKLYYDIIEVTLQLQFKNVIFLLILVISVNGSALWSLFSEMISTQN